MAFTTEQLRAAAATKLYTITPTSGGGAATVDQLSGSSANIAQVEINNTNNASTTAYLKLYNVASGSVTLGTTTPYMVLPCPGGDTITYALPKQTTFPSALSVAMVTTGGTAGTTSMAKSVTVTILQG